MIKVTCQKCSKLYELEDDLGGKTGKCTCGELLEIKNPEPVKIYQLGDFHNESLQFLKNNMVELFGFTIIFGVLIGIINSYSNNLGLAVFVFTYLYFKITIIIYTYNKNNNNNYQLINATEEAIKLYPKSLLVAIGIIVRFYGFTILMSPLIFLIIPFMYIVDKQGPQFMVLPAIMGLTIYFIPLIIIIIRYAFVFQNSLINKTKGLDTVKETLKQIKGIKKNIFYVNGVIIGTTIVIMFVIFCIYSICNAISGPKSTSMAYIYFLIVFVSELLSTIYITKMFMQRTGINSKEGLKESIL